MSPPIVAMTTLGPSQLPRSSWKLRSPNAILTSGQSAQTSRGRQAVNKPICTRWLGQAGGRRREACGTGPQHPLPYPKYQTRVPAGTSEQHTAVGVSLVSTSTRHGHQGAGDPIPPSLPAQDPPHTLGQGALGPNPSTLQPCLRGAPPPQPTHPHNQKATQVRQGPAPGCWVRCPCQGRLLSGR